MEPEIPDRSQRSQKHRGAQRTDADRADDRKRKQAQRERDYAARDATKLAEMDPVEARLRQIFYEASLWRREPQPRTRPAVPPPLQVGWWIGKSSAEIKAHLIAENPRMAEFFERKSEASVPVDDERNR